MNEQQYIIPQSLPNATAVLVLGIVSIVFCCMFGIVGLACGIVALVLAGKGKTIYDKSPELYTLSSYNNLNAGKICAIIGVSISSLALIFYLIYIALIGTYISIILALLGIISQNV